MKKSILLVIGLGILGLAGCTSQEKPKAETEKTPVVESSQKTSSSKSETKEVESEEFTVKGTYVVGEDIQPGTYYMVLNKLDHAEDDPNELTEVYINMADSKGKHLDTVYFSKVGEKERVKLQEGDTIQITDNGIEYDDFSLKFLNDADFKKYTQENK